MFKRTFFGLAMAAVVILMMFLGQTARILTLLVVATIANIEMHNALKNLSKGILLWPSFLFSIAFIPAAVFLQPKYENILLVLFIVIVMIVCAQRVLSKNITTKDLLFSLVNFVYPLPFFVILLYAMRLPSSIWQTVVFTAIACACLNDTCALFAGKFFGKTKLSPLISPKKTREGAIGGFVGATLTAIIVWAIQGLWGAKFNIGFYVLSGVLASVAAVIGDLSASLIKRETQVKDFGKILPGHGGMLDRVDSILFAVPVVFIVFSFAI